DVAVDTVRRRVRVKGAHWVDLADRPALLALLACTLRRSDRRATLSQLAREVLGLEGRLGASEVANAVQELGRRLTRGGQPVIELGRDRAQLARGLTAGILEEG